MVRARVPVLTALLGAASLVACAAGSAPTRTAGLREAGCTKVSSEVASALRDAGPDAHVKVVVDMWWAPRAGDVLQAGVADCTPAPAMLASGSAAPAIPWGEYENGPSQLPATCVGWATRAAIARWCDDPAVHRVDVW
jgi:hypothetical protein